MARSQAFTPPPARGHPREDVLRESRAKAFLTELFGAADIRFDGTRPWDIRVNDERFYARARGSGSLGFGESYMNGWWDCAALDAMIYRVLSAGLPARIHNPWNAAIAWVTSYICNLQSRGRARIVGRRHYDLGNEFFAAMLDPAMQYSCAWRGRDSANATASASCACGATACSVVPARFARGTSSSTNSSLPKAACPAAMRRAAPGILKPRLTPTTIPTF